MNMESLNSGPSLIYNDPIGNVAEDNIVAHVIILEVHDNCGDLL
jgi:hypothetical protein